MTERKTNARTDKQPSPEMTRGHTFLTEEEVDLLNLRSKYRHKNISSTIQELVQPAIDRFENVNLEERERQLKRYVEQVLIKSITVTNAFEDSKPSPYELVHWVLPKPLIDRLDNIATQGRSDRDSLMSCILSNAIDMRNNN